MLETFGSTHLDKVYNKVLVIFRELNAECFIFNKYKNDERAFHTAYIEPGAISSPRLLFHTQIVNPGLT